MKKSLLGSSRDTYVVARARIHATTKWYRERHAAACVAYKRQRAPTNDSQGNKLTAGVREELAVEAVDWRPKGVHPFENPFDVLMFELEEQFRYNHNCTVGEIRNFTAHLGETSAQRYSRMARLIAENLTIINGVMAVRVFMGPYSAMQRQASLNLFVTSQATCLTLSTRH